MRDLNLQSQQSKDSITVIPNEMQHSSSRISVKMEDRDIDSPATNGNKHKFGNMSLFGTKPLLQKKLKVNEAGDEFEKEADSVADEVMRMRSTDTLQTKMSSPEIVLRKDAVSEKEEGKDKKEEKEKEENKFLQRKESVSGGTSISPAVTKVLQSTGQSLNTGIRSFMEPRFGFDFSKVRIHDDVQAHQSAKDINALAYTHQNNIVFGEGNYQPQSDEGKKLLAHELTHVVQQYATELNHTVQNNYNNIKQFRAYNSLQLKGGTVGGFFSNIGRGIVSIFGNEPGFDDATCQEYLAVLDSGDIEDDYNSDDKARFIVRKWMADPKGFPLTKQRKLMLIKEMLSGVTGDADEKAILNILTNSTDDEVGFILGLVKPDTLRDKINGAENKQLEAVLTGLTTRKVQIGTKPVNMVGDQYLDRLSLLGDGSGINPGLTVEEFQGYITKQADWYTESTLKNGDREILWKLAVLFNQGDQYATGLARLSLYDLGAVINKADWPSVLDYAEGAATTAQTVRITRPDNDITRVIELGKAMQDLNSFVPHPVLRVCIDQSVLETLVDEKLIPELQTYYNKFSPTIENPAEMDPLHELLKETIAPFITLTDWLHDLHIITSKTRKKLLTNISDKTRKRPVLLVLMSGLDWNTAFLQASNLEEAITNSKNLGLLIQGAKDLKAEITQLDKVADDYGQIPKGGGKPRLGQVVIAGHGQDTSVEQTTTGSGASSADDRTVSYNQQEIQPTVPGDDSEKLIDEILQRMDPAQARIVFAGCLVGSHDVPLGTITNIKNAAAEINASIKSNPNLRDEVNVRMAALGIKGTVEAANASTTFSAFNVDKGTGVAKLRSPGDPDIGGTKASYVKTGIEPEGALRSALETWADPKLGPTWTTTEMRTHVNNTKGNKNWYICLTRTAFEIALPKAGDVDPVVINDLAHRVDGWLFAGWESMADVNLLNAKVNATEAPVLYPVMLASDFKTSPHLPIVVQQAWMQLDPTHKVDFMKALDTTLLMRVKLAPLIADGLVDPLLKDLLKTPKPAKPDKGQLLLALTIAVAKGSAMPVEVTTLLTNAAGGARTTKFPVALNITPLLDGASELTILRDIGLAPGASTPKGSAPKPDDANLNIDKDKTNETFVSVKPRSITLDFPVDVRTKPDFEKNSKIISKLVKGDDINVVGTTSGWTVIDVNGTTGFILFDFP